MQGKRVMVITAHPDDETYCAGTLAKLADDGNDITLVVATSGNRGTIDPAVTPEALAARRHEEMDRAARILGARAVIWLGYDDGGLYAAPDLKERLFRAMRQYRPDVVFTFDPWKRYDFHSDHRTVGFAATEAAYLGRCVWYYPEHKDSGLAGYAPAEVYLFHPEEPNLEVDVSAWLARKLDVVVEHASQEADAEMRRMMRLRSAMRERPAGDLAAWAAAVGESEYLRELSFEKLRKVGDSDLAI